MLSSTEWLILAVIVDSAVTLFVGWRLERAAKKHTAKAAETVRPAIQSEIAEAIEKLLPLIVAIAQEKLGGNTRTEPNSDGATRAITKS